MNHTPNSGKKFLRFVKKNPVLTGLVFVFAVSCGLIAVLLTSPARTNIAKSGDNPYPAVTIDDKDLSALTVTSVSPNRASLRGIATDTDFVLTTSEDVSPEILKTQLTVTPPLDYTIERTDNKTYTLTYSEPLPEDTVIQLLHESSANNTARWAFQTGGVFAVSTHSPSDMSSCVPVDSGIEISFSHGEVSPKTLEQFFSISPAVEGRFEQFRSTTVFIPSQPLKPLQQYEVKIAAGCPSSAGETLAEDTVFRFMTDTALTDTWCYLYDDSQTFLPGEQVYLLFNCAESLYEVPFQIKLYRYANAEAQREALLTYTQSKRFDGEAFPVQGLEQVYENTETIKRTESKYFSQAMFMLLPSDLPEGHYLAELTCNVGQETIRLQKRIQISSLSVYAARLPNAATFFVNDTLTGNTVPNANISVICADKTYTAKTDASGVGQTELSCLEDTRGVLSISDGTRVYLDLFDLRQAQPRDLLEDYFVYMYTDREVYMTTDTVRVWGVVRPRYSGLPAAPADLTLMLGDPEMPEQTISVAVASDGVFFGEFSISAHEPETLEVRLMSGDTQVESKYLACQDYVKPAYVLDIDAPDYVWMPQKQAVDIGITAAFYDGTPAENLALELYAYDGSLQSDKLTVDSDGKAHTTFLADNGYNSWHPRNLWVSAKTSGAENEYQNVSIFFYGFQRDVMIETSFAPSDGTGTLTVKTNHMNIDKIQSLSDVFATNANDLFRGAPLSATVTATVMHTWFEKKQTGEKYDFLQKVNVPTYEYESHEEVVNAFDFVTENGVATLTDLPVGDEDNTYEIILSLVDSSGQLVVTTCYLGRFAGWDSYEQNHSFKFENDNEMYMYFPFTNGETLSFQLRDNNRPVTGGRILTFLSDSQFMNTTVLEDTQFTLRTNSDMLPNKNLSGAYFDGKHVFPVLTQSLKYNSEAHSIRLRVSTDKESYAPGETAAVTILAENPDGKPAVGASVLLSVVDEAAFSMSEQTVDTLGSLYRDIYFPWIDTYMSHKQNDFDSGEEGGEGGNDSIREDFKDTAAFLTCLTDSSGSASFSVKLPDNLTTWRLTAQAVSSKDSNSFTPNAGHYIGSLPVRRSFFLTSVALPYYVEGDDVAVSARANGTISGTVSITASLTGSAFDMSLAGHSGGSLSFGKVPAGKYTLRIAAKDGQKSDAIEQSLTVVSSALETSVTSSFNLADGVSISPRRYPVTLSFFDSQYELYGSILGKLYESWGGRADFRIARAAAERELGLVTEEEFHQALSDISSHGFISIFPYTDSDYFLTALVCAAAPDVFRRNSASDELWSLLQDSDSSAEEVCVSLMGLAALGEPVLLDILDLLERPAGLSDEDRLRLVTGLALLGDETNAARYYEQLTAGTKTVQTGPHGQHWIVAGSGSLNTKIRLTALYLPIASALRLEEANGMATFLRDNDSTEQTTVLELLIYLRQYKPKTPGQAAFSYDIGGKTVQVKLDKFSGTTLSMTQEQLRAANFKVLSGEVKCFSCYTGDISLWDTPPKLKIIKTVTPVSGGSSVGDVLKVTLKPQFDLTQGDGFYSIDDVIPSCARYAGCDENSYFSRMRQGLSTDVYYSPDSDKSWEYSYFIRCVLPGTFVQEGAVLRDSYGQWGQSPQETLVVSP